MIRLQANAVMVSVQMFTLILINYQPRGALWQHVVRSRGLQSRTEIDSDIRPVL